MWCDKGAAANWDNSRWTATMTHSTHALHIYRTFWALLSCCFFSFFFSVIKTLPKLGRRSCTASSLPVPPPHPPFLALPLPVLHKWSNYYCHVIVGKWSACLPAWHTLTTNYTHTYVSVSVSVGYVDNFTSLWLWLFFTVAFKQYRNLSNEVEDRPQLLSAFVIVLLEKSKQLQGIPYTSNNNNNRNNNKKSDSNSHLSPCAPSESRRGVWRVYIECTSRRENLSMRSRLTSAFEIWISPGTEEETSIWISRAQTQTHTHTHVWMCIKLNKAINHRNISGAQIAK